MKGTGSLVCVGIGMTLGSHLTPLSRSYIEDADVVFAATSDGIVELWLAKMNPDVRSLQSFYREGKSRADTYRQMVAAMLAEVRAGKPRVEAFKNFAARTKVDEVRSLVAMLVQTDRFGTSVALALRTHAEVSRTKRALPPLSGISSVR